MKLLNSISEIADSYDCFLLDLWGVLFDGYKPYPGALDCLYSLKNKGKRTAIATNWPRRSAPIVQLVEEYGIPPDSYGALITAGEIAHITLRDRSDKYTQQLGQKCFLLCGEGYESDIIEGLSLNIVFSPKDAEFALCIGPHERAQDIDAWESTLAGCREVNLPMICANPDVIARRGDTTELTTGALAKRYEELGGQVRYFGKPLPDFFHSAIKLVGANHEKTVMIGDGILTDIKGAEAAGIDSIFITGGIALEKLNGRWGETPDKDLLSRFIAENRHYPTYSAPAFRW